MQTSIPWISTKAGEVSIRIRLQPRSSRNEIQGIRDDVLRIRVTAPPVDEAANLALRKLLSELLEIPLSGIVISHGIHGRIKSVNLKGISESAIREKIETSMRD